MSKASPFLRASMIVSAATMLSRITGFVRDVLLAQILGAGFAADIFVIAFRLPNLFRRLFGEGAFNAAFVPLFTETLARDGRAAAQAFAARLLAVLAAGLCTFVLLAEIFMPHLVLALAQGFRGDPEKFALAVYYARIAFPYLLFIGLLSLFAAILNATGRFWATACAPIIFNLVLLMAIALSAKNAAPLDYIIGGISIAGVAQLGLVFWAARRAGWRLPLKMPQWRKTESRFFKLALPGILAGGIGQINIVVGTSIATAQAGAAAWLYYADRLYQLPMALIGVALAVVLLPDLSQAVAAGDAARLRARLTQVLIIAMALTLPAMAGLYVLSEPIVRILFERGAFAFADSVAVGEAVRIFAFGLPAFVILRALQAAHFAHQDTRGPLIDGAWGVMVNIALSLSLFPLYGHVAIAYGTVSAGWVSVVLMAWRLHGRGLWSPSGALLGRWVRQCAASVVMAMAVAWLASHFLILSAGAPIDFLGSFLRLGGIIVCGAALFGALAWASGGIRRDDWH